MRARVWSLAQSARVRVGRFTGRIGPPQVSVSGAVCPDVATWAATHQGATAREVFPGRDSARTPPRTVEPTIDATFTARMHHQHDRRALVAVHDARMVGTAGLVVLPDGSAARESVFDDASLHRIPEFTAPRAAPEEHLRGDHISLLVPWATTFNLYHWLHDSLLRLHEVVDELPPGTRAVVPGWLRPFQVETLRLLGFGPDRLVRSNGRTTLAFDTLHCVGPSAVSGYHRAEADRWLADRFRTALVVGPPGGGRRLYLSRRYQRRPVADEAAVVALLDRFGFEAVCPERLSLRDQVALFGEASVIVAPHGAALHGMIHARSGAVVVDLIGPSLVENGYIFWNQAQELGHEYWYLATGAVDPTDGQSPTVVPLGTLAETLDAAGIRPVR